MQRKSKKQIVEYMAMRKWSLANVDLYGEHLEDANLKDADFRGANLESVTFYGANLKGADLQHAILWNADLRNANLSGANLTDTILIEADLEGAHLKGAKFNIPIGMSSRHDDVVKVHEHDKWHLGCFSGTTQQIIERLQKHKSGRVLRSYLARMLSMLAEDKLSDETEQLIIDALNQAINGGE